MSDRDETQRIRPGDERRARADSIRIRAVGKKVLVEGVVPRAREQLSIRARNVDEIAPDHRVTAKLAMRIPLQAQEVTLERRPFVAEIVRVRSRVARVPRRGPMADEPLIERIPLPREDDIA